MLSPSAGLPRHREDIQKRRSIFGVTQGLILLLLLGSAVWSYQRLQSHSPPPRGRGSPQKALGAGLSGRTLIVYVFRNTDPESWNNLLFFLTHGVLDDDSVRYIIAMDPALPELETPSLPELPPNAEYIRPPSCFEAGVVGWLLGTGKRADTEDYKYFIWLSSAVRGPMLPSYLLGPRRPPWYSLITERLVGDVKLVGATVSCANLVIDTKQAPIQHPHVQNYLMATDSVGLRLIKKVGALDCHTNWLDNIRYSEYAASAAILNAQYNVDCLMLRYQGVNWRDQANWRCNALLDPLQEGVYDGTTLNALEVMFGKVQFANLVISMPGAEQTVAYSDWVDAHRRPEGRNINSNAWINLSVQARSIVLSRPKACFDAEFYIMTSPVEFKGYTADDAYEHFKSVGLREGRPYMYTC